MFGMVVERLFVSDVQKVSGGIERKICSIGIIRMLSEVEAMLSGDYSNLW